MSTISLYYDALGRMVSDARQGGGSTALTYDGLTNQVASDASASYSRDPAGQITGVSTIAGGRLLALSTRHDDLSGLFAASGTVLAGSVSYDPWGQVLASAGPAVQVGYQGQWTDPGTGQVDMGARFYKPSAGGFINQDTYAGGEGGPAVTDNLHAYADDNPMSVMDPSGHVLTPGPLRRQPAETAHRSRSMLSNPKMSFRVDSGNDAHSSPSGTLVSATIWRRCPHPRRPRRPASRRVACS